MLMYQCCQGVIDIAIKLFAAAQARAILDGTEEVRLRHIRESYKEDFKLMQPMLEALRDNDAQRLAHYEDMAPLNLGAMVTSLESRAKAALGPAFTTTPNCKDFAERVVATLVTAGIAEEAAWSTYKEVTSEGGAKNLSDAVSLCMTRLAPTAKSVKSAKAVKTESQKRSRAQETPPALSEQANVPRRPGDIRNFVAQARNSGRSVIDVMKEAGALRSVEEVLEFSSAA